MRRVRWSNVLAVVVAFYVGQCTLDVPSCPRAIYVDLPGLSR